MAFRLKWLTENLGLKLVSLLLAIGFWFYVVGEESIEITRTVPLELRTQSKKMSIVNSSTSFLEVVFQAPRQLLPVLSSSDIKAVHEVSAVHGPGVYSFSVNPKDFSLPAPEIRITKIFPSFVTVTLNEVIVKKLSIQVDLVGDPAYGYQVDQEAIELDPNAILVEGPKAVLEKMDAIKTEPIQLVGRVRSFRRSVKIRSTAEVKPLGDGITEVQIPIKAQFAEKELTGVPVKPLGIPSKDHYVRLESDRISIVLKGPQALLDKLGLNDILAYVKVDQLERGSYEMPVELILPPELSLRDEAPLVLVQVNRLRT